MYVILISISLYADVNECDGMIHSCQQVCINTPGSHSCDCFEGFELSIDGISCEGLWLKQHKIYYVPAMDS